MTHIEKRDQAIGEAHELLSEAIRQLNLASIHTMAQGDDVYTEMLSKTMRKLCKARVPLTEHVEWMGKN